MKTYTVCTYVNMRDTLILLLVWWNRVRKIDNTRLVMSKLLNVQWYDDCKKCYQMSIVNEGCAKWHDIGLLIDMQIGLSQDKHDNTSCFTKVLEHWISTGGNANYPATWIGLQNILLDSELLTFDCFSSLLTLMCGMLLAIETVRCGPPCTFYFDFSTGRYSSWED